MKLKKLFLFILTGIISLNMICCKKTSEKIDFKDGYPDLSGKHIVVYVAFRDELGRTLLELFKQKTGCTYEYLKMSTEQSLSRIKLERKNPKADIFIGGTCEGHILAKKEGLLEKYISTNYNSIDDKYKDKEGYWTGLEVSPLSIVVNKDRWEKEFGDTDLEIPKSYEDLLNPIYNGKIVISDPNTSGTAYTMLASIFQSMGQDKALELLKKLKSNVGEFTASGYTPGQKVATGEYLIGINFLNEQLSIKNSGFNIESNVPANSGWSMDAVSKIKDGPNGDVGKYFIDFVTDKDIQKLLISISFAMSTRKDIQNLDGMDLSQLDIYEDYNLVKASNDKEALVNTWNNFN